MVISFFLVTGTRWKVGGFQIQLTFSRRFDSLSFSDAWRWAPGGIRKGRRKEAANGTRASHEGYSHVAGPIFIIQGAFCILTSVKQQFFISKAELS